MTGKKRVAIAALVLVVAAVAILIIWLRADHGPTNQLVLYGNIDLRQVDLAFNVSGVVEKMLVEEGDEVKIGQLLAVLDDTSYRFAVDAAQARVDTAKAVLAKLEAGSRPEEIARARARVAEAEARVRNAQSTFERQKHLAQRDNASQQALDDARRALDEALALTDSLKQDLTLAIKGPRRQDIDAARATLETAQAELARQKYFLSRARLYATVTGTVLTRIQEPGAVVLAHTPVYTVSITDPVWARTYVSEVDLGKIYPGMIGRVVTDAAPDKPYRGKIGFISPTAEFTPKTVETRDLRTRLVYRLRVYIDNPNRYLRQGMPVTVYLDTGRGGTDRAAGRP